MKILQISNRIPFPLNEGGTIGIYNYTRGFSEAGCSVTLLTLHAQKHKINLTEAGKELSQYCRFIVHNINTDVRPVPAFLNLFTNKSYNVIRFYDKAFEQKIEDLLKSETFDVIQVEGTFPAVYTDVILKYSENAKVILRQHNVEYQIWERLAMNESNPAKKWYLNLLTRRLKKFEASLVNRYDAIVPVTPEDGVLFRQMHCIKPIFPSPAGIDIQLWKPSNSADLKKVFHIGSLEWLPNLEAVNWFLEDIWPLIHQTFPELQLFIAGKGMPQTMKAQIIDGVEMAGEVENAPIFIEDKMITIVPLKSGSGIRLKILEAMAAGKIVISTTIGAQGIHYSNGENILIADTPQQFTEAFGLLKSQPELSSKLSENARKLIVDEYSNESVIQKLLNFYDSL
ncbi:MAG: glycosyltransferase [Bacteroidetes bacterium]|nr:glycosyltransferase [Bacteroidota bacterium]